VGVAVAGGSDGVAGGANGSEEDDDGADVSELSAPGLLLTAADVSADSGLGWPDDWLGPQAVSKSASAAAAVVPVSPEGIR
jgi:hypothetical protein